MHEKINVKINNANLYYYYNFSPFPKIFKNLFFNRGPVPPPLPPKMVVADSVHIYYAGKLQK